MLDLWKLGEAMAVENYSVLLVEYKSFYLFLSFHLEDALLSTSFCCFVDDEDDVKYSKIISASIDDLLGLVYEEKRQLETLLHQEDTQVCESTMESISWHFAYIYECYVVS